jgi:hypothetical protein
VILSVHASWSHSQRKSPWEASNAHSTSRSGGA